MDSSGPDEASLAAFRQLLREFLERNGDPGIRELERRARAMGKPRSRSDISAKLNGTTRPDWDFVRFILEAGAGPSGKKSVIMAAWRDRYKAMVPSKSKPVSSATVPRQLPGAARSFVGRQAWMSSRRLRPRSIC